MTGRWRSAFRGLAVVCAAASIMACRVAGAVTFDQAQPCEPIDPKMTALNYNNDYNDPTAVVRLHTVEANHFDTDVQLLRKGETAPLPRDLDFVLRAFPNHYAALNAMATWQLTHKGPLGPDSGVWTADCYFLRAISFRPDDWKIHYIYAIYLDKAHRLSDAGKEYDIAEKEGATGPDYFYNRGLYEVDAGNLAAAKEYAAKARAAGDPLPGLSEKIGRAERAGRHTRGKPAPASRGTAERASRDQAARNDGSTRASGDQ